MEYAGCYGEQPDVGWIAGMIRMQYLVLMYPVYQLVSIAAQRKNIAVVAIRLAGNPRTISTGRPD